MKRIALAGLFLSFVAGTTLAQTGPSNGVDPSAPSSRVILKGVNSAEPVVPASATTPMATTNIAKPQEDAHAESSDLATCDKCGQPWTDCCCPSSCGWSLYGSWLYLQPRGADPVYAARALNCFDPPFGGAEQIDFGWFSAFQVGFAKTCGECCDIGANWTHFESQEEDRAVRTTGTDVILPLLFHPDLINCPGATSTSARASAGIDFDRVNIDYRCRCDWTCFQLDWLVGFGYGSLEQDLTAYYDEGSVRASSNAYGYGVRLGGGASYSLGCFRGYSHADLTLLASNVEARYRTADIFDGQEVSYKQHLDRIMPVLDLEVGIACDLGCHTTLKLGYMYSVWWNVVTTPSFIEDAQKGDITGNSGDVLTFDGVFARIEINF